MHDETILLVEDDPGEEALALRALKKNNTNCKVFVARDGEEALDFFFCRNNYAERDPNDLPHLTLLDVKLPKLDGLEVLRRLRQAERTRLLPIVMLSSSNEAHDVAESYKYGANSYVRKAIDFTEFVESVKLLNRMCKFKQTRA
jgi:two-component system response regulator